MIKSTCNTLREGEPGGDGVASMPTF